MKKWKESIKKAGAWKPDTRIVAGFFVLALILLLIPLLRICRYTTPWYDDYSYGNSPKNFLALEYSLGSALQGVLYCVKTMWYAWQGTFSSIFFMALVPSIWGEQYYFLGPMFLVLILPAAVFVLVKVLVRDVLGADYASCLVLQVTASVLALVLMHTARSGLFWYNSGIHYIGMHSFLMLYAASLIKLLQTKNRWPLFLLMPVSLLGALLCGGANFVTSLQGMLVTLSVMGIGILCKRKRVALMLPAFVVYACGFYLNLSAPGNDKRMGYYTDVRMGAGAAVVQSFAEAFKHLWAFTGWMTIALLLLVAPVIWQMVKRISFRFRYPGLVLLWSFCLYATGFTPSLYSLGNPGLGRTLNAVKLTFQLLFLLNEVYWLGWLEKTLEKRKKKVWSGRVFWWFYPVMGAVMLLVFLTTPSPEGIYSSWGAYYFVHTGEADNYYREYLERVEVLKGPGKNVVVKPYMWNPWLIRVGDLSEDPNREENQFIAQWYGKDSVVCK
ncbi:MAG: hypothetical protein NC081_01880 [Roseburia sp.]|nr:hypothetical protein [Roseburia sp.]